MANISNINGFFTINSDGNSTFTGNVKLLGVLELNDVAQSIDFLQSGAINFDSNNDQTGRVLTIGSGRTGASGGTTNVTFSEDGTSTFAGNVIINRPVTISPNTVGKNTFEFTTNAANDGRLLMKSVDTVKVDIQANGNSYFNGGIVLIGATGADIGGSNTGIRFNQAGSILASIDETTASSYVAYFDRRGTNNEGTVIGLAMQGFFKASIGVIGTSANVNDGGITFNTLATNGGFSKTERMRVTSDGSVLIGKASFIANSMRIDANGITSQSRGGTGNANWSQYYNDNGQIGAISVIGGNNLMISGTVANHAGISFATNSVLPMVAGADSNNAVDLGQNGNTFKSLYLGGTINSTGAANFGATSTISKAQETNQFDTSSFLRLHPSATTNSSGYTNMFFGTSTSNNFGVAIGGVRVGTGDTGSTNDPAFSVRILNDSVIGSEVLRINHLKNATFSGNILFSSDSASDIGGASGNRPRDIRVGRSIGLNASPGAAGTLVAAGTGTFGDAVTVVGSYAGISLDNTSNTRFAFTNRHTDNRMSFDVRPQGAATVEVMNLVSTGLGIGTVPEATSRLHIKNASTNAKITLETADAYDSFINYSGGSNEMSAGFDIPLARFIIAGGNDLSNPKISIQQGTGTLTSTGDIIAYSDKRLKKNIKTLDGSKVYKMRGVSFEKDDKQGAGVIAQEMQEVAPELVSNDGKYLGVAYGNISGYLIEAIKELEARIKILENK